MNRFKAISRNKDTINIDGCKYIDGKNGPSHGIRPENLPIFLEFLERSSPTESLVQKFRLCPDGLFVDESYWDSFIQMYRSWLAEVRDDRIAPSEEKVVRKLCGSDGPRLWYLLDGKVCLSGYLVSASTSMIPRSQIPRAQGVLQDPRKVIHPRDSKIADLKGVTSSLDSRGFELSVTSEFGRVRIAPSALEELYARAITSRRIGQRVPRLNEGIRELCAFLPELFRNTRTVAKRRAHFVPQLLFNDRFISYRQWATLHFAFRAEEGDESYKRLVMSFDLVGPGLRELFEQELSILRRTKKNIGSFQLLSSPGRTVGTVIASNENFRVTTSALRSYFLLGFGSKVFFHDFQGRFSMGDIVKSLERSLTGSSWMKQEDASRFTKGSFEPGMLYRSRKPWLFLLKNRTELMDIQLLQPFGQGKSGPHANSRKPRPRRSGKRRI